MFKQILVNKYTLAEDEECESNVEDPETKGKVSDNDYKNSNEMSDEDLQKEIEKRQAELQKRLHANKERADQEGVYQLHQLQWTPLESSTPMDSNGLQW